MPWLGDGVAVQAQLGCGGRPGGGGEGHGRVHKCGRWRFCRAEGFIRMERVS